MASIVVGGVWEALSRRSGRNTTAATQRRGLACWQEIWCCVMDHRPTEWYAWRPHPGHLHSWLRLEGQGNGTAVTRNDGKGKSEFPWQGIRMGLTGDE